MGPFWLYKCAAAEGLMLHVVFVAVETAPLDCHLSHWAASAQCDPGTPLVGLPADRRDRALLGKQLRDHGGVRFARRTCPTFAPIGGRLLADYFVAPCDRRSAFVDLQALQRSLDAGDAARVQQLRGAAAEAERLTKALQEAVSLHLPLFHDPNLVEQRLAVTGKDLETRLLQAAGPRPAKSRLKRPRPPDIEEDAILHELGLDRECVCVGDAYTAVANRSGSGPLARLLLGASTALGASKIRTFFTVTIPGCKYGLISAAFVVFTLVITDFGVPKVIE